MELQTAQAAPYLELMKKCLTRSIFPETLRPFARPTRSLHPVAWAVFPLISGFLEKSNRVICRRVKFDPAAREDGSDYLPDADTMIGFKRLNNLQHCIEQVLRENIPGDLIETGVWRGGACIFMRAVLKAYAEENRRVWVADSFEGLPRPDGRYEQDDGDAHWTQKSELGISVEQVETNFSKYGLLDDQVRFLKGWFKDTLPTAPIEKLAILRLDGDLYSSTMDSLQNLYSKLSPGGYLIVDDYGAIGGCRQAVDDFRLANRIETPMENIDWTGVYWKKQA